ncbi:SDR family NAD(P)-dependent oxidoreductase [Candidatus Poriferisodalis sp.]|uniref:SDR family NAD(P)-dependent oxidoreductase n=1 Tax=Candidatus Poriferisodalis sp. TaxID=3101277 RepID=UPI003C6FD5BD
MGVLDGRVAIITGGARGQGAVEGQLFADEGATVVLTDVLDEEGERTAGEVGCEYLHQDVASEADWDAVVADVVNRHGRIDVLVNNAGIFQDTGLMNTTAEDYHRMMSINALGPFLGMQKVGSVMAEAESGSIINISSVAGLMGTLGGFAYGASKWAVRGMTKSAAKELGRRNVRVNSVHPGYIDTEMLTQTSVFNEDPDRTRRVLRNVPLGRIAEPAEVGRVVLFLASDASSYCTGQEFTVDGGMFG